MKRLTLLILISVVLSVGYAYAGDKAVEKVAASNTVVMSESSGPDVTVPEHGIGHKLLFYIPNRFLDLIDVFRARLRVGPGLSGSFSFTQRGAFFGGKYNTVYVGLPGPRAPKKFVSPIGREKQKGIIMMGVNATDDTKCPPRHGPAEIQIGAQALIVGVDVGFDIWELGDFFTGLVFIDLRKDDL